MELKEYILPLRRWWWLILAATLVAVVSAAIATQFQLPTYRTQTTIMIGRGINDPNPSSNDLWMTQQLATTYSDMIQRQPVRQATMDALGMTWLPAYTVRVVPNTQLMEIAVVDTSPERVQAVATELVNQLIRVSPTGMSSQEQQRQEFINRQLGDLEVGIDSTKAEIEKKQEELTNMFSARQIADAQTQIAGLQSKLTSLQSNYAALLSNTQQGSINTISVVEVAALPTTPVNANALYTILLAAAIGFGLAAGAAYLLEYLDDTLKNHDEVQKALGLTTMGAIPDMELAEGQNGLVMDGGQSQAAEAYRILRTNMQFASVDTPLRKIMVTSPAPSEGKTLTAANLAAALANAGNRVVIVDADLHKPRQHRMFKLVNNVGLTTALLDEHPNLDLLLQATDIPGLRVLTSGPMPPNPAELLGSSRMRALLDQLLTQADVVILDSPPITAVSDPIILSTQSDGVLLVLDTKKTRREVARRALEGLRQVNAHVIGALLNRMPTRGSGYYYYYYYYYQGDYYKDEGEGEGKGKDKGKGKGKERRRRGDRATHARQPQTAPVNADSPSTSTSPS